MGEYANSLRQQAAGALRQTFRQAATPGIDPIVELIGRLLGDETDHIPCSTRSALTNDQWSIWNELALTHPQILTRAITRLIERERLDLPVTLETMRIWAATLVLSTLDWLALP